MPKSFADFDQTINKALNDWHIPGAAVAVLKGDKLLHKGGYGYRDVDKKLPVTDNTRFPIASMTKPFTAMGAALLVEEGLLEWDQPIRDVMPEFRLYDEYASQHASLRDLLSHRTGLPRHDATWYGNPAKPRMESIKELRHLKPSAEFRSQWQYNNLMYETVGHLCAVVTETDSWETFLQQRILDVLKLENTTPNFKDNDILFSDTAQPYRLPRGTTTPVKIDFYKNALGPAGSMYSTLNDMATWLGVHVQQGMANGAPFIAPYHLKQMHTPHMLMPATVQQELMFNNNLYAYGMGWFIEPYNGVTVLHHGGNINGFSLMAAFVPQQDIAIVVLTNIDGKPLRNVLLYEALDRALAIGDKTSENKNWSDEFLQRTKVQEAAASKNAQSTSQDRLANAPATHALADYAGEYQALAYADINVKYENNALQIFYYGQWWPLEHYQHNVFEMDMTERFDERAQIVFEINNRSQITGLRLPIEPDIDDMTFTRKALTPSEALAQQLAGRYDFPSQGQEVVVSLKEGDLYIALTGQPEKKLACVSLADSKQVFHFNKDSDSVLEFLNPNNTVQQLVIKKPGETYECRRIA